MKRNSGINENEKEEDGGIMKEDKWKNMVKNRE